MYKKMYKNHKGLGGGGTRTLVAQPLKIHFWLCVFPIKLDWNIDWSANFIRNMSEA